MFNILALPPGISKHPEYKAAGFDRIAIAVLTGSEAGRAAAKSWLQPQSSTRARCAARTRMQREHRAITGELRVLGFRNVSTISTVSSSYPLASTGRLSLQSLSVGSPVGNWKEHFLPSRKMKGSIEIEDSASRREPWDRRFEENRKLIPGVQGDAKFDGNWSFVAGWTDAAAPAELGDSSSARPKNESLREAGREAWFNRRGSTRRKLAVSQRLRSRAA
jgi:hypothetical protein